MKVPNKVADSGTEADIILTSTYLSKCAKLELRAPDLYCFSPAESEKSRNSERRANRKSPMTPSQARRRPKKYPQRQPRNRYDRVSYRRAIQRAVDQANKQRRKAAEEAGVVAEELPRWSPNQLRHAAGTEVRRRFGVEAAQVVLGHAQADVTQVYAERDYELAKRIMGEVG
ncbi:MAG: site-specific integrase [Planctomycetaceae bacterium]|nr:site-specific integrase [Planctomycetaceae bacterium]